MTVDFSLLCGGAVLTGVVSAALYARKRRWQDAALALVAGGSLAAVLALPVTPPAGQERLLLSTDRSATTSPDDALARALALAPSAAALEVQGDGLREAQWRDLPARPLVWQAPAGPLLRLEFPRTIALGRMFTLTARRLNQSGQTGWRLQLLAENGQVLSEAQSTNAADALSVQWQPPLAENLVLQARLLDSAGKTLAQGPVPLRVQEPVPLQIQGRFGAPSFDARVLNQLLTDGGALLDWQTTLGKSLTRSEQSSEAQTHTGALIADAAWMEKDGMHAALAQAALGTPLLVLGGNADDAAQWQRALGLKLEPQSATTEAEDARHLSLAGTTLTLAPAAWNPAGSMHGAPGAAGGWQILARDRDGKPWLWQRDWQRGRVIWLGVRDWHRHAITEPGALGQWWQRVMDLASLGIPQKVQWIDAADPMPLAGLRTEVCAQGPQPGAPVQVDGVPTVVWQARADRADAVCAGFWPARAGWTSVRSGDASTEVYVYAPGDWPAWQQALRQDATRAYASRAAARTDRTVASSAELAPATGVQPAAPADGANGGAGIGAGSASGGNAAHWPSLPRWPFGIAFAAAMLLLWWRERR